MVEPEDESPNPYQAPPTNEEPTRLPQDPSTLLGASLLVVIIFTATFLLTAALVTVGGMTFGVSESVWLLSLACTAFPFACWTAFITAREILRTSD